ncbi:hypothetical protein [Metabacillus herbersteinensis]|uniref:hypothetical protein n=1 Tax=Metabacillus herbersteinensis TaxID=283816 RepID=UPI0036716B8B
MEKVDEQLLHYRDARDVFVLDKMEEKYLKYYINNVVDKPWNNHLFFALLVYREKNVDVQTNYNVVRIISTRLSNLFEYFYLTEMEELNIETQMYQYFKGSIFEEHTDNMRANFLSIYRSCSYAVKK